MNNIQRNGIMPTQSGMSQDLGAKVEKAVKTISELTVLLTESSKTIKSRDITIAKCKAQLQEARTEFDGCKKTLGDRILEVEKLKKENQSLKQENSNLQDTNIQAETELTSLRLVINGKNNEINQLEIENTELQKKNTQVNKDLESANTTIEEITKSLRQFANLVAAITDKQLPIKGGLNVLKEFINANIDTARKVVDNYNQHPDEESDGDENELSWNETLNERNGVDQLNQNSQDPDQEDDDNNSSDEQHSFSLRKSLLCQTEGQMTLPNGGTDVTLKRHTDDEIEAFFADADGGKKGPLNLLENKRFNSFTKEKLIAFENGVFGKGDEGIATMKANIEEEILFLEEVIKNMTNSLIKKRNKKFTVVDFLDKLQTITNAIVGFNECRGDYCMLLKFQLDCAYLELDRHFTDFKTIKVTLPAKNDNENSLGLRQLFIELKKGGYIVHGPNWNTRSQGRTN